MSLDKSMELFLAVIWSLVTQSEEPANNAFVRLMLNHRSKDVLLKMEPADAMEAMSSLDFLKLTDGHQPPSTRFGVPPLPLSTMSPAKSNAILTLSDSTHNQERQSNASAMTLVTRIKNVSSMSLPTGRNKERSLWSRRKQRFK